MVREPSDEVIRKAITDSFDFWLSQRDSSNEVIRKAITDSFDFWLSQHDVTVPALFEAAVRDAVSAWLDDNRDELLDRIARRAAGEV